MSKTGEKYRSRNGLIGTVEDIRGAKHLVVRKPGDDKILQTINIKDIELENFKKIGEENVTKS